jgi:hypothetical protein
LFCGVDSRFGVRFESVLIVWGIDVVVDGNYLASQKREFEALAAEVRLGAVDLSGTTWASFCSLACD